MGLKWRTLISDLEKEITALCFDMIARHYEGKYFDLLRNFASILYKKNFFCFCLGFLEII